MPFSKASDVPDNVPEKYKPQFMEVWNSVYAANIKAKMSPKDAEDSAYTQAHGVINKAKEADRDVEQPGSALSPGAPDARYSPDQAREPDGKFGSGSQGSPHESDVVKANGGFVPHAAETELGPGGLMHGFEDSGFDKQTLSEHMDEFLKEGNVDAYSAFKTATKALSGDKISHAIATSAYKVLSEHLSDAHKDGNTHLESALKSAMTALHGGRDLSQLLDTEERTMTIERRYAKELRVGDSQGDEMSLVGYAAMFNSQSKDLGGFRETIAPGAFTRAIAEKQDVHCLFNHDSNRVLGRTSSGTLKITQDDRGLQFRCALDPNQQSHRDLHAAVKRGDISECSFAFAPNEDGGDEWKDGRDDKGQPCITRTLKDVDLFDVSAVTHPAYNSTSVNARNQMVTPEIRSIIKKLVAKRGGTPVTIETRDESVEQTLQCIGKCLAEKFPCQPTNGDACCSSWGMYYVCDTYDDYLIACNNAGPGPSEYVKISYVANPDGDGYVFGTPTPVEKEWVPSDRAAKTFEELRTMKAKHMQAIADAHTDQASQHGAVADAHTDAASDHAAQAAAHTAAAGDAQAEADRMKRCEDSNGDCDVKGCRCQNCMNEPKDVYYGDDDWDEEGNDDERAAKRIARRNVVDGKVLVRDFASEARNDKNEVFTCWTPVEVRDGKVRTKMVGGKSLTASAFASVGDPNDTSTWKFPVHDADHARNALARWGQHKGIPSGDEAGVYAKIVAAAKKFGIDVTETDAEKAKRSMQPFTADEVEDWKLRFEAAIRS